MHNGLIRDFAKVRRDLAVAVDPALFADIEGSTDSELFFYLALTFGLRDDPVAGVERAVGFIEETGRRHGVENPIQMTVATTDGERVWGFRYSSEHNSRSLFFSTDVLTLRAQYPDNPRLWELSDETRLIVSEPFGELVGAWQEVPESSWGVIQPGQDEIWSFTPQAALTSDPRCSSSSTARCCGPHPCAAHCRLRGWTPACPPSAEGSSATSTWPFPMTARNATSPTWTRAGDGRAPCCSPI